MTPTQLAAIDRAERFALSALTTPEECEDIMTAIRAARSYREALIDVTGDLIAAHSLLSNSPKTGAPSDKIFDQMLADYAASIRRARKVLLR